MAENLTFRYAERKDTQLILLFILELARYEKLEQEVVATPEILEEWLFDKQKAEVIFAMLGEKEIGSGHSAGYPSDGTAGRRTFCQPERRYP